MDTNKDVALYAIEQQILRGRAPMPCAEYEATSRDIPLCATCGHDHIAYYELAPELAAEKGAGFVAIGPDGAIEYLAALPVGADIIGPTRGNA